MIKIKNLLDKIRKNTKPLESTDSSLENNLTQRQFFLRMSHEISSVINQILGIDEDILQREDASDEIRRDAANILGSGRMLLTLLNDIYDLGKIEEGKIDIVPVNYSIANLLSEIVNMIWLRAQQKGLKLSFNIDPSIPCGLYGDVERIKQILINLLGNSLKYTKEGSVSLQIEKVKEQDGRVLINMIVSDTGMGIKRDDVTHIFDLYKESDGKSGLKEKGFGLYIVKQLVEKMGGSVKVNSVYTQGSVFTVSLWQAIADITPVGDISISNYGAAEGADIYGKGFNLSGTYTKKEPVLICTSSMCDLPSWMIMAMKLDVLPFYVKTAKGVFCDNVETNADELMGYIRESDSEVSSDPPSIEEYERFFAKMLTRAHHIIYITITSSMSEEFERASSASGQFDNVTVIDSRSISSSTGILVLIAYILSKQDLNVTQILDEIEKVKELLHCSFLVDDTGYLTRGGYISEKVNRLMNVLNLKVSLHVKEGRFGLQKIYSGDKNDIWNRYIKNALSTASKPDTEIIVITYVDLSEDELKKITDEVRKRYNFNRIIYQKASGAISVNCGPGSFGLIYMDKGDKSYDISSLIDELSVNADAVINEFIQESKESSIRLTENKKTEKVEDKWYRNIEGIDSETALKNSGSEESFLSVLGIFYDSINSNSKQLQEAYDKEDYESYTIKVHALKSSAKLVGATGLSDLAFELEKAGKAEDTAYIKEHHHEMMEKYAGYKEILKEYFKAPENDTNDSHKPMADKMLMESIYEIIREGAEAMDLNMLEAVFEEIGDYRIPDEELGTFNKLKDYFDKYDYKGMTEILDARI